MQSLADALHPQHGTIIVNMHSGPRPRLGENLLRQLRGLPPLTFDESSPEAVEVIRYARVLKYAHLLSDTLSAVAASAWHLMPCAHQRLQLLALSRVVFHHWLMGVSCTVTRREA